MRNIENKKPHQQKMSLAMAATALGLSIGVSPEEVLGASTYSKSVSEIEAQHRRITSPTVMPKNINAPAAKQMKLESPAAKQMKLESPAARQIKIDGIDGESQRLIK